VPSTLPEGEVAPLDGALPESAVREAANRPLGFYLHVPFCASRCGYCDLNTYTAKELGGGGSQASYAETAVGEVRLARRVLGELDRPVDTVFFGGGTPTLLPAGDLARMLGAVRDEFGLADDAEVTTEANPESVDPAYLEALREAGFTRVSFGMQSASSHVLKILDRRHTPGRALQAVKEATAAGFEHVNLDLIYGTPGESLDDWRASLESALSAQPDHVSAYALIVEDGTQLARRIRRGELPMPDDDDLADKYVLADELLSAEGLRWYEVSNWARSTAARCRHNELYWRGDTWWGIGPGAHSHVGGTRWWNVKHPTAYAERLNAGASPAHARETLDEETRRVERVLLEVRLEAGLPREVLDEAGRAAADQVVEDGLAVIAGDRLVLTDRGRLLADAVVRDLLPRGRSLTANCQGVRPSVIVVIRSVISGDTMSGPGRARISA
jgi:putative oxygen-independent coproporphyrinogen III oxidase